MSTERLSSGSEALDRLLGGGYEHRVITQIYGEAATGKSTLAVLATVQALRTGRSVVYIDTEGFSAERLPADRRRRGRHARREALPVRAARPRRAGGDDRERRRDPPKPSRGPDRGRLGDGALPPGGPGRQRGPAPPDPADAPPARALPSPRPARAGHEPGLHGPGHEPRGRARWDVPSSTSRRRSSGSRRPTGGAGPCWPSTAPAPRGGGSSSRSPRPASARS